MFANILLKSIESGMKLVESVKEVVEFWQSANASMKAESNGSCLALSSLTPFDLDEPKEIEALQKGLDVRDFEPNEIRQIVSGLSKSSK